MVARGLHLEAVEPDRRRAVSWPIWIGVNRDGEPLIGAQIVKAAEAKRELHDFERVYPSQLRYRVCVFLPDSPDLDDQGRHFEGLAPSRSPVKSTDRTWSRGRWRIMTRTAAADLKASGVRVLGRHLYSHEFPRANHARSVRVLP
jgi:hypothetical protein